jgi:hypothetical protein
MFSAMSTIQRALCKNERKHIVDSLVKAASALMKASLLAEPL